jgi:hypothetical protein
MQTAAICWAEDDRFGRGAHAATRSVLELAVRLPLDGGLCVRDYRQRRIREDPITAFKDAVEFYRGTVSIR